MLANSRIVLTKIKTKFKKKIIKTPRQN